MNAKTPSLVLTSLLGSLLARSAMQSSEGQAPQQPPEQSADPQTPEETEEEKEKKKKKECAVVKGRTDAGSDERRLQWLAEIQAEKKRHLLLAERLQNVLVTVTNEMMLQGKNGARYSLNFVVSLEILKNVLVPKKRCFRSKRLWIKV